MASDVNQNKGHRYRLESSDLQLLIDLLKSNRRVLGPTIRDGAIVFADIDSIEQLPQGWGDDQEKGRYRLRRRDDVAFFGHNNGPGSLKQLVHKPHVCLWQADKAGSELQVTDCPPQAEAVAVIGVRACDVKALAVQDKVLTRSGYTDGHFAAHKEQLFLVAIDCHTAAPTCFCTSHGYGPGADRGYDLGLAEVCEAGGHYFLVRAGSDAGLDILNQLPVEAASQEEQAAAQSGVERARASISRTLPTRDLPDLILSQLTHPQWDKIAERCLSCGNCTLVCPTCFCTTVEDTVDLNHEHAERWRHWDSCFNLEFSYLNGGSVRQSTSSRYRQWLSHKLGTWHKQFDESGCVGCGRCVTWCPVGIDLTEEVAEFAKATESKTGVE